MPAQVSLTSVYGDHKLELGVSLSCQKLRVSKMEMGFAYFFSLGKCDLGHWDC